MYSNTDGSHRVPFYEVNTLNRLPYWYYQVIQFCVRIDNGKFEIVRKRYRSLWCPTVCM